MSKQPEALRLADALEDFWGSYTGPEEPHELNAAAELRRLHALNDELLEALRQSIPLLQELHDAEGYSSTTAHRALKAARSAIAKSERANNA